METEKWEEELRQLLKNFVCDEKVKEMGIETDGDWTSADTIILYVYKLLNNK